MTMFFDRARLLLMDNDPKFALKDIEKVLHFDCFLGIQGSLFLTIHLCSSYWFVKCLKKVLVTQPNDFHAICTHAKVIYQVGLNTFVA